MDITSFMSWFINLFINLLKFIFNTLDSITFNGTSLLKYCIGVTLIIPILEVIFTLVKSGKSNINKADRMSKKESRKDYDTND